MDLDLALVRSFVVTAEELHFRRAAERLLITQQALSQRIRRLESQLGVSLFVRSYRNVDLTAEGRRFFEPARQLLASAEDAVGLVRASVRRPLRVDVVDGRLTPLRLVRRLVEEEPDLLVNLSMRQSLGAALPALIRGEIDGAFGRVHDLTGFPDEVVAHRLVRLEPVCALVPRGHPLTARGRLRMADLRETGLWMPNHGQESEWQRFVRRVADEFALPLTLSGPVLTEEDFVRRLREHGDMACLGGADASYDYSPDIRCLPLVDPTPVYPWSLVWRRETTHPFVERMLRLSDDESATWLAYEPGEHWLPQADRDLLDALDAVRNRT